jgi:hypothetical protein
MKIELKQRNRTNDEVELLIDVDGSLGSLGYFLPAEADQIISTYNKGLWYDVTNAAEQMEEIIQEIMERTGIDGENKNG